MTAHHNNNQINEIFRLASYDLFLNAALSFFEKPIKYIRVNKLLGTYKELTLPHSPDKPVITLISASEQPKHIIFQTADTDSKWALEDWRLLSPVRLDHDYTKTLNYIIESNHEVRIKEVISRLERLQPSYTPSAERVNLNRRSTEEAIDLFKVWQVSVKEVNYDNPLILTAIPDPTIEYKEHTSPLQKGELQTLSNTETKFIQYTKLKIKTFFTSRYSSKQSKLVEKHRDIGEASDDVVGTEHCCNNSSL